MIYKTLWIEIGSGWLISILEKLNWYDLTGLITLNTGAIDVKMDLHIYIYIYIYIIYYILYIIYYIKPSCLHVITKILIKISWSWLIFVVSELWF